MPYENVEKDTDMIDMVAYERIPNVKKELISQWENLKKASLGEYIDALRTLKEHFYALLYKNNPYRGGDNVYWFELTRYSKGDWRISNVEPDPPPFTSAVQILPKDIISQITDLRLYPDQQTLTQAADPRRVGKTVDIEFIRYSANYLFGIIGKAPDEGSWRRCDV